MCYTIKKKYTHWFQIVPNYYTASIKFPAHNRTPSKSRQSPSFPAISHNVQWLFRDQVFLSSLSLAKKYLEDLQMFFSHQKYDLNRDQTGVLSHKVLFTQYCYCPIVISCNFIKNSCLFTYGFHVLIFLYSPTHFETPRRN